ncbi:MAG: hypothetical protein COX72_01525 [Gammaproteobacteria bacterium CG_4_10_14_0_2_um_filter_38_22]|nr:MAG: hypothetical protein COX72_01525 [Gammaproteobacteria bacterium CG_4_10_14_0_2_um_filter_38_22]
MYSNFPNDFVKNRRKKWAEVVAEDIGITVANQLLIAIVVSILESGTEKNYSFPALRLLQSGYGTMKRKPPQIPPTRTLQPLLTSLCF